MATEHAQVRIEELRLAGFRAFENARLTLDDLTVLVGRNGAGKSTILDAFEFLREALTDSLENALERRGGIQALVHKGAKSPGRASLAIRVRLSGHQPDLRAMFENVLDDKSFWDPGADTTIGYGFSLRRRSGGKGFVVERESSRFSHKDFTYREEHETPSESLELPLEAQVDPARRTLVEILRGGIRAYKLSPAAIRAEPPIGPASTLNRDGSNVGDVLKHVEKNPDDLAWVVKHLAAITPGIVGVKSGTAAGRRIVQFFQASGTSKTRFEIGDMSDGTLRCLAILLALCQRPSPAIVSIDEIEDSVHPAALAILLDAVAASAERGQVLLTSHSPEALSHPAVTAARVRVVDWRDGKSEIFRLSRGAEEMSRPPRSVGKLLRQNALFTAAEPERIEGDIFEAP